ncbi:MAG: cell division protein ZipA C-terminal FtsZ-binding domain-containing protein [Betaproteobacteria bacterium]
MSDLQISLLIIGAVVVGGVYLFNWVQERKFRRKLGQAFESEHRDVLLDKAPDAAARVEPQVSWGDALAASQDVAPEAAPRAAGAATETETLPPFDPEIEYVAVLESAVPMSEAVVDDLVTRAAACGKPCRVAGLRPHGKWEEPARAGGEHYQKLAVALQLADRKGPVNAAQLAMLCDAARNCAARISGVAACPDTNVALKRARELDEFCSDVDVAIGVNVVAQDGQAFSGQRIRSLAEATGFKLEPDGLFHYRDERRQTLFTIDNHEPAPFIPEQINRLSTTGITLLLDVPRVARGPQALDRMLDVGRTLARALGGRLVDDNRVTLNEAGIERIRQQLGEICSRMDGFGVTAGGPRALRLFS